LLFAAAAMAAAAAWDAGYRVADLHPNRRHQHLGGPDMTDTRDVRQIAWDSIRALRDAAARLQLDHQDPTAEDLFVRADALADALMTTHA
jgi:hypothetical protein